MLQKVILEVLLRDSVKPKLKKAGFEACLLEKNLKLHVHCRCSEVEFGNF